MKKILFYIYLTYVLAGCVDHSPSVALKQLNQISNKDTFLVNCDECAIIIKPSIAHIERLKTQFNVEGDFYTAADDANYYTQQATQFLKTKKLSVLYIDTNYSTFQFGNRFVSADSIVFWDIILYKNNKLPKIIKPIDIATDYAEYYSKTGKDATKMVANQSRQDYKIFDSSEIKLDNSNGFVIKAFIRNNEKNISGQKRDILFIIYLNVNNVSLQLENDRLIVPQVQGCPEKGYKCIVSKGNNFTIEQQFCEDFSFVHSYMTFKYDALADRIMLYKYGETYEEYDDEKVITKKSKTYSSNNFGTLDFKDVNIEKLRNILLK